MQLGNPKSGRGRLPGRSLTTTAFHDKFKVTVQTGFHKAGRDQSCSLTRVVARRASTVFDFEARKVTGTVRNGPLA